MPRKQEKFKYAISFSPVMEQCKNEDTNKTTWNVIRNQHIH